MSEPYPSAITSNGTMTFMEVYSLCVNSYEDLSVGQKLTGTGNTWVVEQAWHNHGFTAYKIKKLGGWHAIVFRGSNPEPNDWINNNLINFLGHPNPPQYVSGSDVVDNYGAGKILVGHSLGGGIAMYASAIAASNGSTIPAATIFPAPVIPNRLPRGARNAEVTNYTNPGEVLTMATSSASAPWYERLARDTLQDALNGFLPGASHRRLGRDITINSSGGHPVSKHDLGNIVLNPY